MSKKKAFEYLKQNKKIMRVLWIICLLLFLLLHFRSTRYAQFKRLYNVGVSQFKGGEYENAEAYFESAMWEKHSKKMECKARINQALSITTPITEDIVTNENLDSYIERLEEAKDVLTRNDCAHENDSNGHSRKAQKLKEEIDEYIEYLKEQNPPEEKPEDGDESKEKSTEEADKEEEERLKREQELKAKEQELKESFKQIEEAGLNERNVNLEKYDAWSKDYDYYSGKSW